MKALIIILLNLFVISNLRADLFKTKKTGLASTEKPKTKTKQKRNIISQKINHTDSALYRSEVDLINTEINKKNAKALDNFLNSRNMGISDNTISFDVLSGTIIKGIVLNSIVSSNLESPILVEITESHCDIALNTKLICSGVSRGKRVSTFCSKLITNSNEFEINASLLNIDGTAGLTGVIYTGKEELVLGALAGSALSAALDVSRDRVSTATGELATNTQRNKVITGAMGGLDEAVQIMGDEAKNKETKISIEAGKEVLIFINQRFKI